MAYISFQPKDHYNTVLYTGNGSTNAITGVGFSPNFTWIKKRDGTEGHKLFDSVRGATKLVQSSSANAEQTNATSLTAFNADGFTLGSAGITNNNTNLFASWNWKGGSTTVPSGGSITPSAVSIDTTAKQGIYKWTGNGTAGQTIAHGLGKTPQFLMVKDVGGSADWACYHSRVDGTLAEAGDFFLRLNTTAAPSNNSGYFHDTVTTDTLITIGSDNPVNHSGNEMIMYAFANVDGYSRFGKYFGNVRVHGGYIHLGFTPAFLMIKSTGTRGWVMHDNKRPMNAQGFFNPNQNFLQANDTGVESNNVNLAVDFLSNGFKIRTTAGDINGDGDAILYMAFADKPVISSNGKSATAV